METTEALGVDASLVGYQVSDDWIDLIHTEGFSRGCFAWRKRRSSSYELGDVGSAVAGHEAVAGCVALVVGSGVAARLCAERLPAYMIIDAVHPVPELPRTTNGEVDRVGPSTRTETDTRGRPAPHLR